MTFRANDQEAPTERPPFGGEPTTSYVFDPAIARDLGIVPMDGGVVATCNGKGIQMATSSPLVDVWIGSFDGVRPLLDVGAAYGANSIPAADAGADVLAIDCDETHLEYLRRAWRPGWNQEAGTLIPVYASLPELPLPSGVRASGILCAEVIHFLSGKEVEASFRRLHELLMPGGVLCLTCADASALRIQEIYDERRAQGHPWPGELSPAEFASLCRPTCESVNLPERSTPPYMHGFSAEQIDEVATRAGFRVISCEARMHPGYPPAYRGDLGRPNVQLVALRP